MSERTIQQGLLSRTFPEAKEGARGRVPWLVLRSLNAITNETAITTRYLRRASPDPGLRPPVELRSGDAGGLLNLLGIGKALPGERIAAEEPPPALLAAFSQQAPVGMKT